MFILYTQKMRLINNIYTHSKKKKKTHLSEWKKKMKLGLAEHWTFFMQSQFIYFRADKTSRKQVHLIALIEILLTTYREEKINLYQLSADSHNWSSWPYKDGNWQVMECSSYTVMGCATTELQNWASALKS